MKSKASPPASRKCGHITFVVAHEDSITHVDFKLIALVFMNMQSVSYSLCKPLCVCGKVKCML